MTTRPKPARRAGTRGAWGHLLNVRTRLMLVAVVAIAALLALVAVNASRDWEQQRNLQNDSATGELGGEASLPLFVGAQNERKLTAVYLAKPTAEAKAALDEQRRQTDQAIASFQHLSGTELEVEHRHKWSYVERVYAELANLDDIRRQADARAAEPERITGYYTTLLAKLIQFYQALSAMDDPELTLETRPLVGLFWASEGLSQEDMLIAQARAAGHMTAEQRTAFADAYGTQRVMYERWIAPYLPPKDRQIYEGIVASDAWQTKERIEQAVISAPTSSRNGTITALPSVLGQWDAAYGQVAQGVARLNLSRTQGLLAHGYQRAAEIRTQVYWQVGSSLAAIVAIAILIIGVVRSITGRLRALQASAEETAERLPVVVQRLQAGHDTDVQAAFPPPPDRGDEFTGLQRALTAAQHTAVEMAAAQAGDRRGFAGFVATTSSRALNLVERQLDDLDSLEKKHGENTDLLRDLIGVDHRGVAARRHLDNLLTLAGSDEEPYTQPKLLADLVHDARSEIGEPGRVRNKVRTEVWVQPQAVNAVVHVVAALLDNALSFSHTNDVTVTSVTPVHGTAVEIEDMGTGMTEREYAEANARLSDPPTFETMARNHDGRLGLFVVSHLAHLHGLRVSLRPSDYGGTKAVVMLPHAIQSTESPDARPGVHTQPPAPEPSRHPVRTPAPGAPAITEDTAPPLPKRRRRTHMAPQLAEPASAVPRYDPTKDSPAETVSTNWSAWQAGVRAAEHTTEQE